MHPRLDVRKLRDNPLSLLRFTHPTADQRVTLVPGSSRMKGSWWLACQSAAFQGNMRSDHDNFQ